MEKRFTSVGIIVVLVQLAMLAATKDNSPRALSTDTCLLAKDRGPCDNYSVKWHYDKDEKSCLRFWYGGCAGNNNRFNSRDECENACLKASVSSSNICSLPEDHGSCTDYKMRWRYDVKQKACLRFWYGGCGGNDNRFDTRDTCENTCSEESASDSICVLPKDNGPCDNYTSKWYYDNEARSCVQFWYGGCEGNNNRFDSRIECENACSGKSASP